MLPFLLGHATHPDWRMALALSAAQIDAGLAARRDAAAAGPAPEPHGAAKASTDDPAALTLGFAYFTDHYADAAEALLAELQQRWPGVSWVGSVGVGIAANGVEYFDQPALALLVGQLPRAQFRVFSGVQALPKPGSVLTTSSGLVWPGATAGTTTGAESINARGDDQPTGSAPAPAWAALVHADAHTTDLAELLTELAGRTESGYLFGGLASSRGRTVTLADGVYQGGVSGVAFAHEVGLISRVTQGCTPVGPTRRIGRCDRNLVLELDGRPALDCLVEDLALDLDQPRQAMGRLRTTLAGIADAGHDMLVRRGQLGADTRVRHVLGLDPTRRGVAVADLVETGQQLAFCRRDVDAARRDLVRICSEIREELSPLDDDAGTAPLPAAALADWSGTWRRMGGTAPADAGTGPAVDAGPTPGDAAGRSAGSTGGRDTPGSDSASQRPGAAGTLDGSPAGPGQDADPAPAQQPHEQIAAALYISCAGRGGPHFGAASAELKIVQRALGDVPLVGFFASGEIARHHLYGYTGVLTVLRCTP